MHFLIDGHNLIGKMPTLSLSDPEDEVKLILHLKGWVNAAPNRRVTIYFDGGSIGGFSNRLSSKDIRVIFAPRGKQADDLLIDQLKGLKNARNYTLITSDRRILNEAAVSRVKALQSEAFVEQEGFGTFPKEKEKPTYVEEDPKPDKPLDPRLSESEIKEWLDLFGPVPERPKPAPKKPKPKSTAPAKPKRRKGKLTTPADRENPELADEDLDAWLALFGGEKKADTQTDAPDSDQKPSKKKRKSSTGQKKKPSDNPHGLSDDDLDAWMRFTGER